MKKKIMKKIFSFLVLMVTTLVAQQLPTSLNIGAPIPPSVTNGSSTIIGSPGITQYYYWVVANFPIGSTNGTPIFVSNVPNTLTGGNYVRVSWNGLTGATSYDILRSVSATFPGTCTGCLVGNTSSFTINDTGASLTNYTYNPASYATVYLYLDNTNSSTTQFLYNLNGTVHNFASGGGGGVSSFSAGNLSPFFTTNVSNPTTTPSLAFTLNSIGSDNIFGNFTGGTGVPSTQAIPACANDGSHALVYVSHVLTCATITGGGGGGGTVTTFSATSTVSPFFTTTVSNPTTTPSLVITASSISADNIFGNFTGSSAIPTTQAIPSCANDGAHALTYPSHTLTCSSITGGGGGVNPGLAGNIGYYATSSSAISPATFDSTLSLTGSTYGVNQGVMESRQLYQQGNDTSCLVASVSGTPTSAYVGAIISLGIPLTLYQDGMRVLITGILSETGTGAVTIDCGGGAKAVYAIDGVSNPSSTQWFNGGQALVSYNTGLNSGAGGWRILSGGSGGSSTAVNYPWMPYGNGIPFTNNIAITQNLPTFVQVPVPYPLLLNHITMSPSGGSGYTGVAIYNSSCSLLGSSTLAAASSGFQDFTFSSLSIPAGTAYVAFGAGGGGGVTFYSASFDGNGDLSAILNTGEGATTYKVFTGSASSETGELLLFHLLVELGRH